MSASRRRRSTILTAPPATGSASAGTRLPTSPIPSTGRTYTAEEYAGRIGWGHSTWQEGVRLARAAGVGRLVLFHHEPDHDDQAMLRIEAQAQALLPATVAAREGATLVLE